jgi:hypothetical protein
MIISMAKLGKTNQFPRGMLNKDDEGELRIAIGMRDKTIIVDFGTETTWIGLDKDTALALADALVSWAQKI